MKKAFRILPICFISILNPLFSVQAQETERVLGLEEMDGLYMTNLWYEEDVL